MPWQMVQFPKFPLSTPYEMYGEECLILMLEIGNNVGIFLLLVKSIKHDPSNSMVHLEVHK